MAIGTILTALSLLKDFAPSLGDVAKKFLDGKATSEELAYEASRHHLDAETQLALAQVQLNANEATHASIFVAGWRPFIGWIGGFVLMFNYIVFPFSTALGFTLPTLDLNSMMPIILGMLGVAGARTYEKVKGVARNKLEDF